MSGTPRRLWRPRTPATVLLLLSPFIGEVLNGATRLSYIFSFVPQIMVWGCGTLLIREVVYRWRGGWASIAALGMALSMAVETLILQTSVAPIPWLSLASIPVHDRVWGVNWFWLTFMLGYEAVWIVLVPILITELIFPAERDRPWLRTRGLIVTAITFLLGSLMLWALWTQTAVPIAFKQPKYFPPLWTLGAGLLATVLLILAGYALRRMPRREASVSRAAPSPWLVGVVTFVLACVWWGTIVLVFAPVPSIPLWAPIAAAIAWAAGAWWIIQRWSTTPDWNDRHRWALSFGALLVCMLLGYLGSSLWPVIDLVGKIVLNAMAVWCMTTLARKVWRREAAGATV